MNAAKARLDTATSAERVAFLGAYRACADHDHQEHPSLRAFCAPIAAEAVGLWGHLLSAEADALTVWLDAAAAERVAS